MLEELSKKLQTIIGALSRVQTVYSYERANADGTPFATLTPSSNEAAYQTTSENRRVYAFTLRLFVERKGQSAGDTAEMATRALVDDVLDALDRNHQLTGMGTRAGYTYLFMEAAPSTWGYSGRENEYRVAEINIRVHFSVDVNVI